LICSASDSSFTLQGPSGLSVPFRFTSCACIPCQKALLALKELKYRAFCERAQRQILNIYEKFEYLTFKM
jgi:hypothetical protein